MFSKTKPASLSRFHCSRRLEEPRPPFQFQITLFISSSTTCTQTNDNSSTLPAAAHSAVVQRSATTTNTANTHKSTSHDESCTTVAQRWKKGKHGGSTSRKLWQNPTFELSVFHSKPHVLSYFFYDADRVAEQRISKKCLDEPLKLQRTHSPFSASTSSLPAARQVSFFHLRRSI